MTDKNLMTGWKRLEKVWERSEAQWDDQARQSFEKQYWLKFEQTTRTIHTDTEHLQELLKKAKRSVK